MNTTRRTTLMLDDDAMEVMKALPRNVSMSAIMRTFLKSMAMSDKKLKKYLEEDEEAVRVKAYLKPKLRAWLS